MRPLVGLDLSGNTLTPLDDLRSGSGHLGRPVWNATRLLQDLELRLGLPSPPDEPARVQQWARRLARLAASDPQRPFYASAYSVDPTGTAAQLLALRDELVLAGWGGQPLAGSERLRVIGCLEAITEEPLAPGLPDRLARVQSELERTPRAPYTELQLCDDALLWPGRWHAVFDLLKQLGTRIDAVPQEASLPVGDSDLARLQRSMLGHGASEPIAPRGDGSLILLRGPTSGMLAEAAAGLLALETTASTVVVRGVDPGPLDAALERYGLGRQGVDAWSRWRAPLQVLRLAIAAAFSPSDPRRVLELLTLPAGPFAGRTGRVLAAVLCDRPGIGNSDWQQAKAELSDEQRVLVEQWLESRPLDPRGAPRSVVLDAAQRTLGWLTARAFASSEPAFLQAAAQARAFADAVRHDGRSLIDRAAIDQLLQDATASGSSAVLAREQAGRLDHVDGPERLLCSRDRVLWWGCAGEWSPPRSLLRAAERDWLRAAGFALVDPTAQLRGRMQAVRRCVLSARRQLILVIPEQVAGERCRPHPLLDDIVARLSDGQRSLASLTLPAHEVGRSERLLVLPTEPITPLPLPSARAEWHLDPSLFRARAAESASSIEKRIACALDWTLTYQAGLRTRTRNGLPTGPLLYGKLAHRVLEELHQRGELRGEPKEVRAAAENVFDGLLSSEAAVLLIAGSSEERHQLRSELVDAMVALSMLIHDAGLDVVGVEVGVTGKLRDQPLAGRIDLLLRGATGEEVILDLKYGHLPYAQKLEDGHAIQLAVYNEARRLTEPAPAHVTAGYFSLKRKSLIATDAAALFQQQPNAGPPVTDTWQRVDNTLQRIEAQLALGRTPVRGVAESTERGYLRVLGVESDGEAAHIELPVDAACKYCAFGPVCGRSWEQPW